MPFGTKHSYKCGVTKYLSAPLICSVRELEPAESAPFYSVFGGPALVCFFARRYFEGIRTDQKKESPASGQFFLSPHARHCKATSAGQQAAGQQKTYRARSFHRRLYTSLMKSPDERAPQLAEEQAAQPDAQHKLLSFGATRNRPRTRFGWIENYKTKSRGRVEN